MPPTSAELRGRRRAARALRLALPLGALAVVAGGCGASLGGRYDSATTAPAAVRCRGRDGRRRCASSRRSRCRRSIRRSRTRASRAPSRTRSARRSCATRMPQGLPGTVIVPGLARDLPVVSRGSRTFRVQLLAGLRFADGSPPDDAGRARDVRAAARSGDAIARARRSSTTSSAPRRSRRREPAPARRARQRRADHVHAQALGSGLPGAPGDADRVPGRERHAAP